MGHQGTKKCPKHEETHLLYREPLEKKEINIAARSKIRIAKRVYRDKVEHKYTSGDLLTAWKEIKSVSSISRGSSGSDRNPILKLKK